MAHLADLRAEVDDTPGREAFLDAVGEDWRQAELSAVDRGLCAFAEKLTREPAAMRERDVQALRELGLDDRSIHDATQVVAYFNYINRVADALDVELEPEMPPRPGTAER